MKSCSFLLLRRKRSSIFFLLGLLNPRIRRWQSVSHHLAPVVRNRSSHRMFPPAGTPLLPTPPPHAAGCRRKSRTRALVYSALGYSCYCLCSFQDSTPQTVLSDVRSQEPISSLDYDYRLTNRGVGSRRPGRRPICYIFS